ncbi:MAG: hypothetical protein HKN88_06755 [Gammaproteobacteria bacterium]|nr:hypothetical protein [Gammaproteobacteria bacterium]NNC97757.1 hypothetical protein [Gammaproteobacteria bacterium]NNM13934.1 hypothetical protein [Gammaproteobacteria bacterium]
MLRKILAVITGVVIGVLGISLVQAISGQMYPWPEGLDYNDKEAFVAFVKTLPTGAFLMVILSYIVGSFFGGMAATAVAKEKYVPALIVGFALTIAGVMNAIAVPQPLWVSIISVLVFFPFVYLGAKVFPIKSS